MIEASTNHQDRGGLRRGAAIVVGNFQRHMIQAARGISMRRIDPPAGIGPCNGAGDGRAIAPVDGGADSVGRPGIGKLRRQMPAIVRPCQGPAR